MRDTLRASSLLDTGKHPNFLPRTLSRFRGLCSKLGVRKRAGSDIVIAVLGVTGAGKSSFIATATGRKDIHIGHDLNSATSEVKPYRFSHGPKNYVLVDTPGFDDSRTSDETITEKIVRWLESSYRDGTRLSGIIYVHSISKLRMQGSAYSQLKMFRQLIGDKALGNVVLATSFWDQVTLRVGAERERELIDSPEFWAKMVAKGSEVVRLKNSRADCLKILERIASKKGVDLQAQRGPTIIEKGRQKKWFKRTGSTRDVQAGDIEKFQKCLKEEKETEVQRIRSLLEKGEKSHKKAMGKLRNTIVQQQRQTQQHQSRTERKHQRQMRQDRRGMDQAIWQAGYPLQRMAAEQSNMESHIKRLNEETRSYRNRANWTNYYHTANYGTQPLNSWI